MKTMSLTEQRCLNHALREAVALCPSCRRFFCRECITEHDDRVICAGCLKKQLATQSTRRRFGAGLAVARSLFGLLLAWVFFYLIGQGLLSIPSSLHEGVFWKTKLWEEP
jgi:hypothetical protein